MLNIYIYIDRRIYNQTHQKAEKSGGYKEIGHGSSREKGVAETVNEH